MATLLFLEGLVYRFPILFGMLDHTILTHNRKLNWALVFWLGLKLAKGLFVCVPTSRSACLRARSVHQIKSRTTIRLYYKIILWLFYFTLSIRRSKKTKNFPVVFNITHARQEDISNMAAPLLSRRFCATTIGWLTGNWITCKAKGIPLASWGCGVFSPSLCLLATNLHKMVNHTYYFIDSIKAGENERPV